MFRIVLALVFALSLNDLSYSQLVPRDGSATIAARSEHVLAVVEDGLARTTLRQTFVNPGERSLEAVFEFPLPEGAALIDVAMTVGGNRLEGLLAERRRARATYDRIVRSKRDPALVEQVGASTYRLSVFPVVPHEETIVELTWIEHAPLVDGAFHYVLPLAERPPLPVEGTQAGVETELFVEVRMRSSVPFELVTASRADAQVVRAGPGEALVTLETTRAQQEDDLVVTATLDPRRGGLSVKTFREGTGDGWFLALFTPPRLAEEQRIARDVILVIDTSGSMNEDGKLEQARRAASWLIEHAHASDRLNVLRFSSDVQAFAPEPVAATPENRARLSEFVAGFQALGGTALGDALKAVTELPPAGERVRTIVLLTDGKPTSGETDRGKLVQLGLAARATGARVFPFGVGGDVDSALLRGVASAGGGRAELFRPGGEIATRLVRFLARTAAPQLAELELGFEGIALHDVFPRPLTDAYLGEQVAITGRYTGAGEGVVRLTGKVRGDSHGFATQVEFPAEPGGSEHVRQLFARQKLAHLEELHRLRTGLGDDAYYAALDSGAHSTKGEIVEEMIAVSLGHGVQCAYTSFLVLLPEDRAHVDPRELSTLDAALERARALVGRTTGEPVLKDAEIMDLNEEEPPEGDPDFLSDSPFDARSFNDVIGVGGGAGGGFRCGQKAGALDRRNLDAGLARLVQQQHADGAWGAPPGSVAATGLPLLALLGDGHSSRTGLYRAQVTAGLKWLRARQDFDTGRLGDTRAHAIATLAVCEAYAVSLSPLLRGTAQKAVTALAHTDPQDAELAAWRLLALRSAGRVGLTLDFSDEEIDDAELWRRVLPDPGSARPAEVVAFELLRLLAELRYGREAFRRQRGQSCGVQEIPGNREARSRATWETVLHGQLPDPDTHLVQTARPGSVRTRSVARAPRTPQWKVNGVRNDLMSIRWRTPLCIGSLTLLTGFASNGATDDLDRSNLPIPRPTHPPITEMDARDAQKPPRFEVKAPEGAPNVVIVLIDDIGFGATSTFGGGIHTPTFDRLAEEGLRFNRFHTTALCSPTRASLLSGRNHHEVNVGCVMEIATGFPGNQGERPTDAKYFAETLRYNGYSTAAFGKWHETPTWEVSVSGPYFRWPTNSGFDKFYGFIGGETNQWDPVIFDGVTTVHKKDDPDYHFTSDMTDEAIEWVKFQQAMTPEKPFFIYFATGATHAPHHAPKEFIEKYDGKFDAGWMKYREETFARQKAMGVIPPNTKLAPMPEDIEDWEKLGDKEKELYALQMEAFAGFAEHTDVEVGRLVDAIDEIGVLDNTLLIYIMGDNGSSGEGGLTGTYNELVHLNGIFDAETTESMLARAEDWGGPDSFPHFSSAWAVATDAPFTWTKQMAADFGGTRNAMVMHWPAGIEAKGEVREQWHHVNDVAATVLEATKLPHPERVDGVAQKPLSGVSMLYATDAADAPGQHKTQYFEMFGNRAIYHDGWLARVIHRVPWQNQPVNTLQEDVWDLYNIEDDFSLTNNLASEMPDKLEELKALFEREAIANNVYPLDDRTYERFNAAIAGRPDLMGGRTKLTLAQGMTGILENCFINEKNSSKTITADVSLEGNDRGVILCQGGKFGGWVLYMDQGKPAYTYNWFGLENYTVASPTALEGGQAEIKLQFDYDYESEGLGNGGVATLFVNGEQVAQGRVDRTQPAVYSADETADVGQDDATPVANTVFKDVRDSEFTGHVNHVTIEIPAKK